MRKEVCFDGIIVDGFFVIVLDLQKKKTSRLLDRVFVGSYFRHHKNFEHVADARYEYRFYKMQPFGFQFVSKFRSHYGGIEFLI